MKALTRLVDIDERLSRVVECRFFGGMTKEETAEALRVSCRTMRNDWASARGSCTWSSRSRNLL